MEDKNVELLATLFDKKPEEIKEFIEKDELAGVITEYKEKHKIFTSEELTQKIDNVKREAIDTLGRDGKQLPSRIYDLAKGNAFEKKEKQIAEAYKIEKWESMDDLISQVVEKESDKAPDLVEKENLILELKKKLLGTDQEKIDAVEAEKGRYDKELIEGDINSAVLSIAIDSDDENKLENQKRVLKTMFKDMHSFERKNGITIVLKDGEPIVNKVGDPVPLKEVVNDFAPQWVDLKKVPVGGRGGSSTELSGKKGLASIKNMRELIAYAEANEIEEGTQKFLELMQEAEKNPDFNM
jgi:hypothetical protein